MVDVYLLVGVPCSGKSFVAHSLGNRYTYVRHDSYLKRHPEYLAAVKEVAKTSAVPVLAEVVFSMSQTVGPLKEMGVNVIPVFIVESSETLRKRRLTSTRRSNFEADISRQETYLARAIEGGHFWGTSQQVLEHLGGGK